ncbi:glycogen debranching protein GlgX [Gemmobacter sp. 24YEA27]|uniref:glycogen debranching protein GlgX n=1 Tax=Gemmobacter sp. 24YEA27 TaxID=3040672 RepID=UPI0024B3A8A0|nr:glycogen debranching protein GlgX [Gemmobacter sp. 24YEA27]
MTDFVTGAGQPFPMGASLTATGVNFATFSANATAIDLCLFSPDGSREIARLPFVERNGDIWHLHIEGLGEGALYGFRVHGPWAPEEGHRFNPNKLLIDPWARGLHGRFQWDDAVFGYVTGDPAGDLSFDTRDSAAFIPKSVVTAPLPVADHPRPGHSLADSVICEAHLRGATMLHPGVDEALRGTCGGFASDMVIGHLSRAGVTDVEFLPVHAIADERFLVAKGLRNYWGYNTLNWFVPEPRYTGPGGMEAWREMVTHLHRAGIGVILDVVYNHSAESDEHGPHLSLRGLDNASFYRLAGGRHYANDAGTGNTLDLTHPMVLRLVMDSLRYWVETGLVDGFRFDLATVLAREPGGFDPGAGFLDALRQDPVLSKVRLIAEPWDIGPGGYQLGGFPPPFSEWNDRYRDGVRRFWRGEPGRAADLAGALLGSAGVFDHSARQATASVNFLTSHDGFTLQDLVSYSEKHNEANGEGNRDGHSDNHSDNLGVEGPSNDPVIRAARDLRKRNLLATLFLSQGVPMWLMGDEIGHSQGGNNNAYAQDNAITWADWSKADQALTAFVSRFAALRRAHPELRQHRFLHGKIRADGFRDVIWRRADGQEPSAGDWQDPEFLCLCLELRMTAEGGEPGSGPLFLVFNPGGTLPLRLPETQQGWQLVLDTTRPDLTAGAVPDTVPANAVLVMIPGSSV